MCIWNAVKSRRPASMTWKGCSSGSIMRSIPSGPGVWSWTHWKRCSPACPTKLFCVPLTARLPANTELTLYRVLQEALKNVEKHARACHVTVQLTQRNASVQLAIHDDGIGFDPDHHPAKREERAGLGLL